MKKRKMWKMPHTYVILLGLALVMLVLTWVLPAGTYERAEVDGREMVVAGTYQVVTSTPQNLWDFLMAIPQAMTEAADIVFFIFITGGVFAIITKTGVMHAAVTRISQAMKGKELWTIPIFLTVFAMAGGTIGMSEETIAFIPIGILMAHALHFDAMIGMSMIALGAAIGFYAGFMNPFNVGVAQQIAELPFTSGMPYRLIILVTLIVVTSAFLINYGKRIQKDPTQSILYDAKRGDYYQSYEFTNVEDVPFTRRHLLILLVIVAGFGTIAWGASTQGWFLYEIGAAFLGMGILSGFIGGMGPSQITEAFLAGAKDIIFAALVVGVARVILVIMQNGHIIDTVIYYLAGTLEHVSKTVGAIGMYIIQIIINFFIPSGSGQAATTMPIMVPLGDALGITRQTSVLAFQFGDGFLDSVIPTSGVLMAQLALAKVDYSKYLKWIWKLVVVWLLIGMAFLALAVQMSYGPF